MSKQNKKSLRSLLDSESSSQQTKSGLGKAPKNLKQILEESKYSSSQSATTQSQKDKSPNKWKGSMNTIQEDTVGFQNQSNAAAFLQDQDAVTSALARIKQQMFDGAEPENKDSLDQKAAGEFSKEQYKIFENMPKSLRNKLKEDILAQYAKEKQRKISKLPKVWDRQFRDASEPGGEKAIRLNEIQIEIQRDFEEIIYEKHKQGQIDLNQMYVPANIQGAQVVLKEKLEKFAKSNKLTMLKERIERNDAFNCLMWWPANQCFTPVRHFAPCEKNAKFLQVEYFVPVGIETRSVQNIKSTKRSTKLKTLASNQPVEDEKEREEIKFKSQTVSESYNLMDLHVETIKERPQGSILRNEGLSHDLEASNYIRRMIPNGDKRIGKRNVLKMTHTALQFERIFLFFDESEHVNDLTESQRQVQKRGDFSDNGMGISSRNNIVYSETELEQYIPLEKKYSPDELTAKIKEGEANLDFFMDAMKLLLEKLHQVTGEYHGQISAVANLKRPPSPTVLLNEQEEEGRGMTGTTARQQNFTIKTIDINDLYLVDLFNTKLHQINQKTSNDQEKEEKKGAVVADPTNPNTQRTATNRQTMYHAPSPHGVTPMHHHGQSRANTILGIHKFSRRNTIEPTLLNEVKEMKDKNAQEVLEWIHNAFEEGMRMQKRDEANKLSMRFSNAFKSINFSLNFAHLDKIKDEYILLTKYIQPDPKIERGKIQRGEAYPAKAEFSHNLKDYWVALDDQLKRIEFSTKTTDYKLIKQYLIEQILPEYQKINLVQVIDRIMEEVYLYKIQKNATKKLLQWVKKQLSKDSKLNQQIAQVTKELIYKDQEISYLQSQLYASAQFKIPTPFTHDQVKLMGLQSKYMPSNSDLKKKVQQRLVDNNDYISAFSEQKKSEDDAAKRSIMSGFGSKGAWGGIQKDLSQRSQSAKPSFMVKKSQLFFLRGQPDVYFGENLTMKRYKSLSIERDEFLKKKADDMKKIPADELKKHRETMQQKLNEKKWELVKLVQELKDLDMRKKVLTAIDEGTVDKVYSQSNQNIGYDQTFLKSENLKQFDLLPHPFLKKDVHDKIKLFKEFQKFKLHYCPTDIFERFIDKSQDTKESMQDLHKEHAYRKMAIEKARGIWTELSDNPGLIDNFSAALRLSKQKTAKGDTLSPGKGGGAAGLGMPTMTKGYKSVQQKADPQQQQNQQLQALQHQMQRHMRDIYHNQFERQVKKGGMMATAKQSGKVDHITQMITEQLVTHQHMDEKKSARKNGSEFTPGGPMLMKQKTNFLADLGDTFDQKRITHLKNSLTNYIKQTMIDKDDEYRYRKMHVQDFENLHKHPITQAYDVLAEQNLDLKMKLHDYEEKISNAASYKASRRRGGKKTAKSNAKIDQQINSDVLIDRKNVYPIAQKKFSHSPSKLKKFEQTLKKMNVTPGNNQNQNHNRNLQKLFRLANESNIPFEELIEVQDIKFQSEFTYTDSKGKKLLPSQFFAYYREFHSKLAKKCGYFPKLIKNFKKGSLENWDQKANKRLYAKLTKLAENKYEMNKKIQNELQARHQAKQSDVMISLEMLQRGSAKPKKMNTKFEYCDMDSLDKADMTKVKEKKKISQAQVVQNIRKLNEYNRELNEQNNAKDKDKKSFIEKVRGNKMLQSMGNFLEDKVGNQRAEIEAEEDAMKDMETAGYNNSKRERKLNAQSKADALIQKLKGSNASGSKHSTPYGDHSSEEEESEHSEEEESEEESSHDEEEEESKVMSLKSKKSKKQDESSWESSHHSSFLSKRSGMKNNVTLNQSKGSKGGSFQQSLYSKIKMEELHNQKSMKTGGVVQGMFQDQNVSRSSERKSIRKSQKQRLTLVDEKKEQEDDWSDDGANFAGRSKRSKQSKNSQTPAGDKEQRECQACQTF